MTPAGDAAAASAAATAAAQEAEQEQLRRAAVQEDRLLAFNFAGTVSAALQDHQQAAQASAEQAAPITDAVQEQLLVLDQVSLGTVHGRDAWQVVKVKWAGQCYQAAWCALVAAQARSLPAHPRPIYPHLAAHATPPCS